MLESLMLRLLKCLTYNKVTGTFCFVGIPVMYTGKNRSSWLNSWAGCSKRASIQKGSSGQTKQRLENDDRYNTNVNGVLPVMTCYTSL